MVKKELLYFILFYEHNMPLLTSGTSLTRLSLGVNIQPFRRLYSKVSDTERNSIKQVIQGRDLCLFVPTQE